MTRLISSGILVLTVVLTMSWLTACGPQSAAGTPNAVAGAGEQTFKVPVEGGGSYTNVNATGLAAMLENKNFPMINVHIPYAGEIERTDLFIPYDQIDRHLDELPADKSARLMLYCRSGKMSEIAAQTLVKLGYTDVWNLDGGMIAWQAAGHAVLEKEQP